MKRFLAFLKSPFVRQLAFDLLFTALSKVAYGLDKRDQRLALRTQKRERRRRQRQ